LLISIALTSRSSSSPLVLRDPALDEHWQRALKCPVFPPPASFLFAPTHFAPADSKTFLVFDLQDHTPRRLLDILSSALCDADDVQLCPRCCSYRKPALDDASVPRLAEIFFAQTDASLAQLLAETHFVRIHDSLRRVVLPSVNLDPDKQQLSLDWRLLLQDLFYGELSMRRAARPWARYLSQRGKDGQTMVHRQGVDVYRLSSFDVRDLDEACERDGWIFWEMPDCETGWLTLHQVEKLRQFDLLKAPR
jgi:hypothetical protein